MKDERLKWTGIEKGREGREIDKRKRENIGCDKRNR